MGPWRATRRGACARSGPAGWATPAHRSRPPPPPDPSWTPWRGGSALATHFAAAAGGAWFGRAGPAILAIVGGALLAPTGPWTTPGVALLMMAGGVAVAMRDSLHRAREQSWGKGVVLVALTGWGQYDDRRRAREVGFDHHPVKPADLIELLAGAPTN